MGHSNQVREFLLTDKGIELLDVYLGESGVLTGSARTSQEMRDKQAALQRKHEVESKQRELERKKAAAEAQIAALRAEIKTVEVELRHGKAEEGEMESAASEGQKRMAELRKADAA
jgi:circadian clock protein KaiC